MLYAVELAGSRPLMASLEGRTRYNYFYGGEPDNAFTTGPNWCVATLAWEQLRAAPFLYYRVVAVDLASGTSRPSVADDQLHLLPSIRVEWTWPATGCDRGSADRQERRCGHAGSP